MAVSLLNSKKVIKVRNRIVLAVHCRQPAFYNGHTWPPVMAAVEGALHYGGRGLCCNCGSQNVIMNRPPEDVMGNVGNFFGTLGFFDPREPQRPCTYCSARK